MFTSSKKANSYDWPQIWYDKLAQFHKIPKGAEWDFTQQHVIDFLIAQRRAKKNTLTRIRIVEALIQFQKRRPKLQEQAGLRGIKAKLQQLLRQEQKEQNIKISNSVASKNYEPTAEVKGRINPSEPDVIQQFRIKMRSGKQQYATEKAYVRQVQHFMRERQLKSLADFDSVTTADIESHLSDLAVDGDVARATQSQAYYALKRFFGLVLNRDFGKVDAVRSTKAVHIPSVMSRNEVAQVIARIRPPYQLIAKLLYGCGMRISECLRLRVEDIDFELKRIEVHASKGEKSRFVPLPESVIEPLQRAIRSRRVKLSRNPRTGKLQRPYIHRDTFTANLNAAVAQLGFTKRITSQNFRHSFVPHLFTAGTDIRNNQELLGNSDICTTMIYLQGLNVETEKVVSPLDTLDSEPENSASCRLSIAASSMSSEANAGIDEAATGVVPGRVVEVVAQLPIRSLPEVDNSKKRYFGWGLAIGTAIVLVCTMMSRVT